MWDSVAEQWGAWLEAAGVARSCENMVSFTFLTQVIWQELIKEGFAVPSRRSLQAALADGLEDLPTKKIQFNSCTCCSFAHVMNLLWAPLLDYIDSCTSEAAPEWTKQLALHHSVLVAEMAGNVPGADEPMDLDMWAENISEILLRLLKVDVPKRLIMQVMSPVVPFHLAPTPANGLHLLRSGLCKKLVGSALAAQVKRLILAEIAEVPVNLFSEPDLALKVRQDLIESLDHQLCGSSEILEDERPTKRSRTTKAIEETMKGKTEQVLFMLQNRVTCSRLQDTIASAYDLIQNMSSSSSGPGNSNLEVLDQLLSDKTIREHLLLLDGAKDRCISENWLHLRESGRFAGVALATDESPPSQPRFRGLRFQITVFYVGTYENLSTWNSCEDPPLIKSTCLADIMHCPGKKGVDVSRIIEKQLARLGLNCFDVTSGTGDGGGENEGHQGVHAYFENLNPGYVRRRCLPHISWRTCDVAIRASGLKYKALAAYLVEGVTWGRLRELATRTPADGGLGLFRDGSQQCKEVFGKSPCAIVDNRPESDLNFLKVLEGKEHLLHTMATKDLEQRSLNADTRAAILNLADIQDRIFRRILQEILDRCLFLYYWSGKNPSVACETSWDELMKRAVSLILNLEITPQVLERFGMKEEDLAAMDARPKTWVDLAVLQVVGEQDLVAERLQESLEFHRTVSDQAAAHLNLLADNTFRTPWLAAKLLSKDRHMARDAAGTLMRHLATTRPNNRTSFEEHLFAREDLWQSLQDFSNADPAVLLWHDDGRYENLFKFLAPRFLLAPDHVLDAERIHARWQWSCSSKRAQKLQTLNASLRLMHYLENNQSFPSHEELLPNLQAERLEHNLSLEALEADVPVGWRHLQTQSKAACNTTQNAELIEGAGKDLYMMYTLTYICIHMLF
jgi:hypothetical protein